MYIKEYIDIKSTITMTYYSNCKSLYLSANEGLLMPIELYNDTKIQ